MLPPEPVRSDPPSATGRGSRLPHWPLWTAPAGVALGFTLGAVGTIVVDVVAGNTAHPGPAANIIGDIVFDLGFVAAALALVWQWGRIVVSDFGYRRVRLRTAVTAFAVAAIAYYGLTAVYASVFHLTGSDRLPSDLGVTRSTAALVAASVFVCAIAPMAEEFFFRGFIFGALSGMRVRLGGHELGPWIAAIVTGILFGLAHTGSASSQYLIPLGFLGFVLCLVRWRTGSLYPCMALHSANNALALGYNQLGWNTAEIIGLVLASWLVIAAITWPLGSRAPSLA